jgi:hypothetical protein
MFSRSSAQNVPFPQDDDCTSFAWKASTVILAIALIMGVIFRFRMYLQDRSLWLDAANLAINIVEKNYAALWGLLDGRQSAPVGFLFASKFVGSVFGYSEAVLLFLPFLFGVGALILFLILSVDVLGRLVAPLAFIPFASCSTAIYYSGEFKQYSADLFFSVLILFVTHRILKEQFARSWIILFGVVGLISVWFSNTAIFMLAGTGLALLLMTIRQGHPPQTLIALVIAGGVIFLHFLALYLFQIRPAIVESMYTYWAMGFAPVMPFSTETFDWWHKMFLGYAKYPLGFHGYGVWFSLIALVFGCGVFSVVKSRRAILYLFLLPLVVLIVFSIFHLYPITTGEQDIHSRLVLFTLPVAFILIAAGINGFAQLFPKPLFVTVVLGILLIYPSINHMIPWPRFMRQEMKPLVSYLYQHFSPEDSVYVYNRAVPAFRFYTRDESIPFDQGTTVLPDDLPEDVRRISAGKRIWAVISHDFIKNREIINRELETHNGPVTTMNFPGAWLLLSVPHGNLND